jgi:hypothetical protein
MRDHLIIMALGAAVGIVMGGAGATLILAATTPPAPPTVVVQTSTPAPDALLPCITEDASGCYWDASEQGDGTGQDFVSPVGEIEAEVVTEDAPPPTSDTIVSTTDPGDVPVDGARQEWETGTLECGVNAKPAIDQDKYGNWWSYCEPALID